MGPRPTVCMRLGRRRLISLDEAIANVEAELDRAGDTLATCKLA
jgi:hypothetical protein